MEWLVKLSFFCVSQNHAAKITQILNELADKYFPGMYQSDFAVQVTSSIQEAQQYTQLFSNNKLNGYSNVSEYYRTSKTRVCVTVGWWQLATIAQISLIYVWWDLFFLPTDFIQIKGRGTRKYNFTQDITDPKTKEKIGEKPKQYFKIFDFFANCEYFEKEFNYDQVLKLPTFSGTGSEGKPPTTSITYEVKKEDYINKLEEIQVGLDGMEIDRMYFQNFEKVILDHPIIKQQAEANQWDELLD